MGMGGGLVGGWRWKGNQRIRRQSTNECGMGWVKKQPAPGPWGRDGAAMGKGGLGAKCKYMWYEVKIRIEVRWGGPVERYGGLFSPFPYLGKKTEQNQSSLPPPPNKGGSELLDEKAWVGAPTKSYIDLGRVPYFVPNRPPTGYFWGVHTGLNGLWLTHFKFFSSTYSPSICPTPVPLKTKGAKLCLTFLIFLHQEAGRGSIGRAGGAVWQTPAPLRMMGGGRVSGDQPPTTLRVSTILSNPAGGCGKGLVPSAPAAKTSSKCWAWERGLSWAGESANPSFSRAVRH